jgi:hypothetical protein
VKYERKSSGAAAAVLESVSSEPDYRHISEGMLDRDKLIIAPILVGPSSQAAQSNHLGQSQRRRTWRST